MGRPSRLAGLAGWIAKCYIGPLCHSRTPTCTRQPSAFDRLKGLWGRALAALAPLGLALGLAAAPAEAQAAVITFDDLTCSADGTQIANGYAGLNWSNFYCIDGATAHGGNSGYNAGRVSGSHVAYNAFGFPAEFTVTAPGGTKFNFNSVYLTAAWNDNLVVTIVAYRDGTAVSTTTHTLSATAPTPVTLNLSQIDRVRFSSAGGTPHAAYGTNFGYQFAMDNLDINFNLPATGVTATAGNAQATVAFTPPPPDAADPVTGYQASCTPLGGGTAVSANGAASPIVVAGLTNGTTYDCTVAAVNAVGTGAASAPVAVTPQAAPVAAVTAVPTLSQWGLMLLGLAAAGLGARRLRRS